METFFRPARRRQDHAAVVRHTRACWRKSPGRGLPAEKFILPGTVGFAAVRRPMDEDECTEPCDPPMSAVPDLACKRAPAPGTDGM